MNLVKSALRLLLCANVVVELPNITIGKVGNSFLFCGSKLTP